MLRRWTKRSIFRGHASSYSIRLSQSWVPATMGWGKGRGEVSGLSWVSDFAMPIGLFIQDIPVVIQYGELYAFQAPCGGERAFSWVILSSLGSDHLHLILRPWGFCYVGSKERWWVFTKIIRVVISSERNAHFFLAHLRFGREKSTRRWERRKQAKEWSRED